MLEKTSKREDYKLWDEIKPPVLFIHETACRFPAKINLEFFHMRASNRRCRRLHEILHVSHGLIIVMNDYHLSCSHRAAESRNDRFLRLLSLICLCKRHFNASEEMCLNKIRITGCERGGSVWWGRVFKQFVCVCVCVCAQAGELAYVLSHDKCSLSYNLCASKYDVCEDEL